MKTRALITCGLLVGATLFADSTVVKDTVAIADSSKADTLEVQKALPMHEQQTRMNSRLHIIRDLLVARLEAKTVRLNTTSNDSVAVQDTVAINTGDNDNGPGGR